MKHKFYRGLFNVCKYGGLGMLAVGGVGLLAFIFAGLVVPAVVFGAVGLLGGGFLGTAALAKVYADGTETKEDAVNEIAHDFEVENVKKGDLVKQSEKEVVYETPHEYKMPSDEKTK